MYIMIRLKIDYICAEISQKQTNEKAINEELIYLDSYIVKKDMRIRLSKSILIDLNVDGVLYDPPYSPRQVSECYNDVGYNVTWDTTKASFLENHKKEISRIVKIGGKVITFGWNSGGIGYKYGFEIERIRLVSHGG